RLYWRPGDPHVLDQLRQDVDAIEQQIEEQRRGLVDLIQHAQDRFRAFLLSPQQDRFEHADARASEILEQRFGNRKHLQHLQWLFALWRRRRLRGKMRALEASLSLTMRLLDDLEQQPDEAAFLAALTDTTDTRPSEERLQGLDAPVTALLGSTDASQRALASFEAQLPELHTHLSNAAGWFEVFFVPNGLSRPPCTLPQGPGSPRRAAAAHSCVCGPGPPCRGRLPALARCRTHQPPTPVS
ncbi:hypothetical protein, partial [Ktedonospora formicarum]|uniref:hypothetical protein n=1 Tax=Ktedonospora formicarum TaxID=2778364 RepID=UPI001C691B5E